MRGYPVCRDLKLGRSDREILALPLGVVGLIAPRGSKQEALGAPFVAFIDMDLGASAGELDTTEPCPPVRQHDPHCSCEVVPKYARGDSVEHFAERCHDVRVKALPAASKRLISSRHIR